MAKRIQSVVFAVVVIAAGVGLGLWLGENGDEHDADIQTNANSATTAASTEGLIAQLEKRLEIEPNSVDVHVALANAYLQQVRETADTSLYGRVEEVMLDAAQIDDGHAGIFATRSAVAAGRHDFVSALTFAQRAKELNPNEPAYDGLIGDALLELGRYDEAVESFQDMVDRKPNFNAYVRIAFVREIYGDVEGAIEALQTALSAGSGFKENIAWTYNELGKLYLRSDVSAAQANFAQALVTDPDFSAAHEGLARVKVAQNDLAGAVEELQTAFSELPLAQFAVALADVYALQGNQEKVDQQLELAQIAFDQSADGGVNTDLEVALFLANHDRELAAALTLAEAAALARPSVYGADALAWALYKNGKLTEAKNYSDLALRLGEYDALIVFHAGMIAKELGDTTEAKRLLEKALELHPNFSIQYAPVARDTIAELE